jgi:dynein heavy chain
MDVSKFDMVEEVRVAMLYRVKLWKALDEWGNVLVEKWRTAPFEHVDVGEITQKSEYYTKVALQCERNLPVGSSAVAKLKQLVFDFRETMPIVEALGNKNLKVEHWTEIKTIIGLG